MQIESIVSARKETGKIVGVSRMETVDSVLNNGLLSPKTLSERRINFISSFGHYSRELTPFVHGRALFSESCPRQAYTPDDHVEDLPSALYKNQFSIFPVISERIRDKFSFMKLVNCKDSIEKREIINWTMTMKENLEERMGASFLVVCQFNESFQPLALHTNGKEQVSPQEFVYLIFPKSVWNDYRNVKGAKADVKIPIKIATQSVIRTIAGLQEQFALPDYESALKQILIEIDQPIWVHAVRLPTEEDVLFDTKQ